MNSDKIALTVEDIHKSFGSLEVLRGLSLTAHEGDVVVDRNYEDFQKAKES